MLKVTSPNKKKTQLSNLFISKEKVSSYLKWTALCAAVSIISPASAVHLNTPIAGARGAMSSIRFTYQVDPEKQQIRLAGHCTSVLGFYAVVQASPQNRLFAQSAIGLQLGTFSIAYQMQALGYLGNRWVSLSWSRKLHHASHDLAHQPFYFYRGLRLADPSDKEASIDVSASPSDASEIGTASAESLPTIHLPEARLLWDKTRRYLSVEADEVDLGLLASRLSVHPQIEVVQVCAEKLEFPAGLTFPCSLEICHRPSDKMNLSHYEEGGVSGEQYRRYMDCDLRIHDWRVQGDLTWYSPYHRLVFKGANFIEGDAVFYAHSVNTSDSSTGGMQGLHVQGSLGVVDQIWSHIQVIYADCRRGLGLGGKTQITARQAFLQIHGFILETYSKVMFSKGAIFLVCPETWNYLDWLSRSSSLTEPKENNIETGFFISSRRLPTLPAEDATYHCTRYEGLYTPLITDELKHLSSERMIRSANHFKWGAEAFLDQNRRHYYATNDRPDLGEKMHELAHLWNILRTRLILPLLVDSTVYEELVQSHAFSTIHNAERQYGIRRRDGEKRVHFGWCDVTSLGMLFELGKIHADNTGSSKEAQTKRIDMLFKPMEQFLPVENGFFAGVHRICVSHDRRLSTHLQLIAQLWSEKEGIFFNEETFHCLLKPFINSYLFDVHPTEK